MLRNDLRKYLGISYHQKCGFRDHTLSVTGIERARGEDRSKTPMQDTSHSGHSRNDENKLDATILIVFKKFGNKCHPARKIVSREF